MNSSSQPTSNGSNALAWVGLLFGAVILGLIIWDNANVYRPRNAAQRDDAQLNSHVIEVTDTNWQLEVAESKIPVVVDFWAPWCQPCLRFAPTIDRLADLYAGRIKFVKVNVDDAASLMEKYRIGTIPQILIFKGGELAANPLDGSQLSESKLSSVIEDVLRTN